MIKLLLILFLGINSPANCELNFEKFISTNHLTELPDGDNAYLLKLKIRTELNTPSYNKVDQELTAMIHNEGFCMKSEEVLIIGENNKLLIIMPRTRTIIKSDYDEGQLPNIIQLHRYQQERLNRASDKSCRLIHKNGTASIELSAEFDQPLHIQGEFADKIIYTVDENEYRLQKVELIYQPNQKIRKQLIQYIKQDLSFPKSQALRWSNVFKANGTLQNEFLHYEIVKQ